MKLAVLAFVMFVAACGGESIDPGPDAGMHCYPDDGALCGGQCCISVNESPIRAGPLYAVPWPCCEHSGCPQFTDGCD